MTGCDRRIHERPAPESCRWDAPLNIYWIHDCYVEREYDHDRPGYVLLLIIAGTQVILNLLCKIGTLSRRVRPSITKGLPTSLARRKAKRPSRPMARRTLSWISRSASILPLSLPPPASHPITSQSVLDLRSPRRRVSPPRKPHPIPALQRHNPILPALP